MKRRNLSLVLLFFLSIALAFVLIACGTPEDSNTPTNDLGDYESEPKTPTYPTNTYEYKFSIEDNEFAYKLVVTDYDDTSVASIEFLYNGEVVEFYNNSGNVTNGIFDTWGLEFKIENEQMTVEKSKNSGGLGNIYGYEFYVGTYGWANDTYVEDLDPNALLILNEDGTAEFGGVAATYYPIDCNKVVLINNKTGYGIVIGLMEVEGEIKYFTLKNNVDPNFSRPVKIDDFYKAFYGSSKVYLGTGYFEYHLLYLHDGSFTICGPDYYAGTYVEDDGKIKINISDALTSTLVLSEKDDELTFDFEIEKQVKSGDYYVNYYKSGVVYANTMYHCGQFGTVSNLPNDSIIAIYSFGNHMVFVYNDTLDEYYELPSIS